MKDPLFSSKCLLLFFGLFILSIAPVQAAESRIILFSVIPEFLPERAIIVQRCRGELPRPITASGTTTEPESEWRGAFLFAAILETQGTQCLYDLILLGGDNSIQTLGNVVATEIGGDLLKDLEINYVINSAVVLRSPEQIVESLKRLTPALRKEIVIKRDELEKLNQQRQEVRRIAEVVGSFEKIRSLQQTKIATESEILAQREKRATLISAIQNIKELPTPANARWLEAELTRQVSEIAAYESAARSGRRAPK